MTTEQKAKQLALSLIGGDQNPEPLIEVLIEMAQWQKEQDQSTIELAEDHAMLAGMNKMEQQMVAKAIDGKVIANGMGNPILHLWDKGRHLIGKKVKVIVIKED